MVRTFLVDFFETTFVPIEIQHSCRCGGYLARLW